MPLLDSELWLDGLIRLGLAALIGAAIGINRDLHNKPIGLRTLGLVSLGACAVTLTFVFYAQEHGVNGIDASSRIAQGIVSGIGFLGAGVIMRGDAPMQVHGMTTAATIWVAAALGVTCALAIWSVVLIGSSMTLLVLIIGGPIEKAIHRRVDAAAKEDAQSRELKR